MPRETIYRYECSICSTACFSRETPKNWIEVRIVRRGDNSIETSEPIYLCPEHADIFMNIPGAILHPDRVITRGICESERLT